MDIVAVWIVVNNRKRFIGHQHGREDWNVLGVEEINYWQLINWERRNAGKERLANLKNFNVQVNNEPAAFFGVCLFVKT